jgi:hypothetical protein
MLYIWFCKALGGFNSFFLTIKGGQAYYRTFGKHGKLKGKNSPRPWVSRGSHSHLCCHGCGFTGWLVWIAATLWTIACLAFLTQCNVPEVCGRLGTTFLGVL